MKIGYVVPEWPGQTHLWIWREISHLREWQVPIRIFSTRLPPPRDKGKHAFAAAAEAETLYLWPMGWRMTVLLLLSSFLRSPIGFIKCVLMGLTLPVDKRPRWKSVLPLIAPACRLAREVRRQQITHLHSHTPANSAILCMMVKRLTGTPFSQIVNANIEWWGGAMAEKFMDAEFTLFVTHWMVAQMRREFDRIPQDKYALGRVGVDTRKWRPSPSDPRLAPPACGTLRVLSVGRLNRAKGHDVLLRAVEILKRRNIFVSLRIGGDGPERENLHNLARELALTDRVTFLGSISEEQYLTEMRSTDVFVLASNGEPMGVVYMEAMAIEVPAIGTAAGGVGEIITDGVDGLLVPPRNPEMLADAIGKLCENPQLREVLGKAGRRKILEQFDSRLWAAMLHQRLIGFVPSGYEKAVGLWVDSLSQHDETANVQASPAPATPAVACP